MKQISVSRIKYVKIKFHVSYLKNNTIYETYLIIVLLLL